MDDLLDSKDFMNLITCARPCPFLHIVKNPISTSCGHSICQECVPLNEDYRFKCRICNQINYNSFDNFCENYAVKYLLNKSKDLILDFIKKYGFQYLDLFKSNCNNFNCIFLFNLF